MIFKSILLYPARSEWDYYGYCDCLSSSDFLAGNHSEKERCQKPWRLANDAGGLKKKR